MSKSEVQSWISSSASGDIENDDSEDGLSWQRENVFNDWPRSMKFAQGRLLTSKTRIRVQFLQEELLSLATHGGMLLLGCLNLCPEAFEPDMNMSQTLDVFKLLTQTYPRYVDTVSREAVLAVGMALVKRDELRGMSEGDPEEQKLGVTEQILGWLANEVGRVSKNG
jgi:hypothetical protein